MKLGIAVASGTFKGVFSHGVLAQFESDGLYADVYGSSSSSVISCSLAAIKNASDIGVDYWIEAIDYAKKNKSMSGVVKYTIKKYAPYFEKKLYDGSMARYLIATSYVNNEAAAEITQGDGARRLGRKLLIASARKDLDWVDKNLNKVMYDTRSEAKEYSLNADNYSDVAYASTRMLHAWVDPAWINGKPYVDGSYTCSCPALELSDLGCADVIAIGNEPGSLYTSIFNYNEVQHSEESGSKITLIRPEVNLMEYGVDFLSAQKDGLVKAFEHGKDQAKKYLDNL